MTDTGITDQIFLVLEYENGEQISEQLDNMDLSKAREIAIDALEDAPITYLYPGYNDIKFGLQPATHLDYIEKFQIS